MEGKEKMIEIYNVMADMALEALKFLDESKEKKRTIVCFWMKRCWKWFARHNLCMKL